MYEIKIRFNIREITIAE